MKKRRQFEKRRPSREFYLVLTLGVTILTLFTVGFLYYQARLVWRLAEIPVFEIPVKLPFLAPPTEGSSFTDLFSGTGWLNATGTTLYHDFAMTTLSFPPKFEWEKVPDEQMSLRGFAEGGDEAISGIAALPSVARNDREDKRCLTNKCLTQRDLELFLDDKKIALPVELQTPNLLNIAIGSTDKFWLLGGIVRNGEQYRGYVYKFNGANFSRVFDDNDFLSPYPGIFGFGGTSDDWLAIYGAYEGIAWQVRENKNSVKNDRVFVGSNQVWIPRLGITSSIANKTDLSRAFVTDKKNEPVEGFAPSEPRIPSLSPYSITGPALSYQTLATESTLASPSQGGPLTFFHNISRFFPIRVTGEQVSFKEAKERFVGFRPEAIRDGKNWYVYSLTPDKPKLIKLVEDKEGKISAAWDLTRNLELDSGVKNAVFAVEKSGALLALIERNQKTALKAVLESSNKVWNSGLPSYTHYSSSGEFVKYSSVDNQNVLEVGGVEPPDSWMAIPSPHRVTPRTTSAYQRWDIVATGQEVELRRFADLGFDKSKPLEAMSSNINNFPAKVVSARISAIEPFSVIASPAKAGRGNLVQFWLSNDGVFWKEAEPSKTVVFADPQPKLFWRVKFVPDEDLTTSPVLDRLGLEWQWLSQ